MEHRVRVLILGHLKMMPGRSTFHCPPVARLRSVLCVVCITLGSVRRLGGPGSPHVVMNSFCPTYAGGVMRSKQAQGDLAR